MKNLFEHLFEKKFTVRLTIVILVLVGISAVYQLFFFKSKDRDIIHAISNSYIIKEKDKLSDTIVDIAPQHSYINYLFKGYKGGCYLDIENKEVLPLISDFIIFGETRIVKKENDSLIRFINQKDTLSVIFNIEREYKVLYRGKIKQ